MEIKKYYKESNEVQDLSGDYVEIKMTKSTYLKMKAAITAAIIHDKEWKWRPLDEAFDEAYTNGKSVWY